MQLTQDQKRERTQRLAAQPLRPGDRIKNKASGDIATLDEFLTDDDTYEAIVRYDDGETCAIQSVSAWTFEKRSA